MHKNIQDTTGNLLWDLAELWALSPHISFEMYVHKRCLDLNVDGGIFWWSKVTNFSISLSILLYTFLKQFVTFSS